MSRFQILHSQNNGLQYQKWKITYSHDVRQNTVLIRCYIYWLLSNY